MGKRGANTEGYIKEIMREIEDCDMRNFKWTDMQVLMVINSLDSSDEDESQLAEKLTEAYNSATLNKEILEMSQIREMIADFRAEKRERRQIMFTQKKKKVWKRKKAIKRTKRGKI